MLFVMSTSDALAIRQLTAEQIAAAQAYIAEQNLGGAPDIELDTSGRATYTFLNGTRFILGRDGAVIFSSLTGSPGQGTGSTTQEDVGGDGDNAPAPAPSPESSPGQDPV